MIPRPGCLPLLILGLLACLSVTGCGDKKGGGAGGGGSSGSGDFKVALLTTGPVTDGGWNQSAYEGLQAIQKDLGAQVEKQESIKDADFDAAFNDFANHGYRIIFAHGDEFGPAAARAAAKYPNTVFITTGGDEKSGANIAPILFATGEGTYLQGMEAAMVSKTGKGGFIGAQDLAPVKVAADAFEQGAKSVNPKFEFKTVYIGGSNPWNDPVGAKSATETLLSQGADVISHNCDASSAGMFQTISGKPGVYAFGVNADENSKAPNVLSSAFLDIPKAFEDIAKSVKDNKFSGQPLKLGLKENDVRLIDNPALANVLSAADKAKIQQAEKSISDGTLKVVGS